MTEQITILVGKNIGIRNKIEGVSSKLFLHFHVVEAHSIFTRDFVRVWEMVNSLKLIETLVEIGLTTATSPKQIPLMRLCICKTISFTETSYEFGVTLENFVKKLTIVNMVAALLSSMVSIG